ncbi:unnamed protein product [Aureobasidium vineae]|uniref:NADH dehydrogenase [ubiquinone] 1 alpha subcomplex subunit 1 n=1 Tax=Aureobasidium vineae TaxID=2773715 RepID=A0A9N8JNK5_9PEZI|nr:unnamed protein product [Aureobasidium vineae]
MGVPFEALLPYGICLAVCIRNIQNGGKRARHSVDQWDRQMMDRDRRLTGWLRGQVDRPIAPAGFEYSNGWRVEKNLH